MLRRIAVAVALAAAVSPAFAGQLTFQGPGRIYAAFEHYEGSGRVGCLVYVETQNPYTVVPVLIRSADGIPCSRIYRVGRKISLSGRVTQDFLEADSMAFRFSARKPLASAKLVGTVESFGPYTVNRDVQETGCEVVVNTGEAWIARLKDPQFAGLCDSLAVGQSVTVEGLLSLTYCHGDVCQDLAHVVGRSFATD